MWNTSWETKNMNYWDYLLKVKSIEEDLLEEDRTRD